MEIKTIKVSALNQYIKKIIKSNGIFSLLSVEGEVSNVRLSKTGYTYFTLSDDLASISCVCFFKEDDLKDGEKIVVTGEVSIYESKGTVQINVKKIQKIGLGEILRQLQYLKEKLKVQGILDEKMEIGLYPNKIGILTAKNSAALQDILKTFKDSMGAFDVIVYDTLVQGELAKNNILEGLEYFNSICQVDVLIIARGGGSFEDLSIFNDIEIAEKIIKMSIPVVTGIGHETDETLCDFVADYRCHTPTAAADYVIRGYKNVINEIIILHNKLDYNVNNKLNFYYNKIETYKYNILKYNPKEVIKRVNMETMSYYEKLKSNICAKLNENEIQLKILLERLQGNDYRKKLKNGYALAFSKKNEFIKEPSDISIDEEIKIKFDNFTISALVKKINIDKEN